VAQHGLPNRYAFCQPVSQALTGKMNFKIAAIFILFASPLVSADWCENEVRKLLWLKTAPPVKDAKIAIAKRDLKFIAVHGFALSIPGLSETEQSSAMVNNNFRVIEGTGDDLCSEEHAQLNTKAIEYASRYNETIMEAK
jgi:galactitol-specific phosphotransferase system IIC component